MPPKKALKKDAKNAKAAAKKDTKKASASSKDSKSKSLPKGKDVKSKSVSKAKVASPTKPDPVKPSSKARKPARGKSVPPKSPSPPASPVKSPSPKKADKRKAADPTPPPAKVDAKLETVIIKGGAAVDKYVPNKDDFRVHQDSNRVYSATLNQSNLNDNNNKFYIIQVLLNEKTNQYFCFNRWGRVGVPGQQAMKGPYSAQAAINDFNSKHRDKSAKGDYIEIEIKFDDGADDDKKVDSKKKDDKKKAPKTGTSKMDARLQKFINLIFDTKVIDNTMK